MSDTWTPEERQQAINLAMKRAATDTAFRALALGNPHAAVQQVAGKDLPHGFNIRVLEKQDYDLTIVLPSPVKAGGELSDAELEQVAGGSGKTNVCGLSCQIATNIEQPIIIT